MNINVLDKNNNETMCSVSNGTKSIVDVVINENVFCNKNNKLRGKKQSTIIDFIKNDLEFKHLFIDKTWDDSIKRYVPIIFIKEREDIFKELNGSVSVESRSGVFEVDGVKLIAMQLRFNNDDDMLYEVFFNGKSESGMKLIDVLANADRAHVVFVDIAGEIKGKFNIVNPFFQILMYEDEKIKQAKWTLEEFKNSLQKIYDEFKDPKDLWEYLNENSGVSKKHKELRVPLVVYKEKNTKGKMAYSAGFCGLDYCYSLHDSYEDLSRFFPMDLIDAIQTFQKEKLLLPTNEQMLKELKRCIDDVLEFGLDECYIHEIKFYDVVIED